MKNLEDLLRLTESFYRRAAKESLPKDSEKLSEILANLSSLETYQARKQYAERNLTRLSSGSARLVYLTPQDTVIKLAKNDKGIAQNKAESNPKMKSKHLNKIIKSDPNYIWLETHWLDKVSTKDFNKLSGLDFEDFSKCLKFALQELSESTKEKPSNYDQTIKHPLVKECIRLGKEFKLMPGDLARISSWGCKNQDLVLIDAGLTHNIFNLFYKSTSSS